MSIGIILALMPEAIFGNLLKAMGVSSLLPVLTLCTSLMGACIGLCVANKFKLDMISSTTLTISALISTGAFKGLNAEGMLVMKGVGDILNCFIGVCLALSIILLLQDRLKAYKLILLPAITIIVTTLVTGVSAAPVGLVTSSLGNMINHFTTLQPLLMSVLIALSFAVLIVSPMSTVAIALLISLSMNGSAAATIGVGCMALTLGILSYKENGLGTAIAHFMGSPKIQFANFVKDPKIIIPGLVSAGICAVFVPIFNVVGTPMSAGFGLSGLIGPLGHLNSVGFSLHNVLVATLVFVVIPVVTSLISAYIFKNKVGLVKSEQYKLDM